MDSQLAVGFDIPQNCLSILPPLSQTAKWYESQQPMIWSAVSSASVTASATLATSVRDKNPSALGERGVRGLQCYSEWPQVADAVTEDRGADRVLSYFYKQPRPN